jgi:hypothetical protein
METETGTITRIFGHSIDVFSYVDLPSQQPNKLLLCCFTLSHTLSPSLAISAECRIKIVLYVTGCTIYVVKYYYFVRSTTV